MAITDEQKAATLNKYYHQVFTMEDDRDTPILEPRDVEDTQTTIAIQKDDVLKKHKSLKIFSAAGPDSRNTATLSINEASLPSNWKNGYITLIFKKGSRTNPASYRPVSLTSVACKMLEGLLRDRLMVHSSSH